MRTETLRQNRRYFNSRPHKEVDECDFDFAYYERHFNSRPHKEVDKIGAEISIAGLVISIHDLTRRSTLSELIQAVCKHISIHDLTRRSTRKGE